MISPIKGRGTPENPQNRFDRHGREEFDDGWFQEVGEVDKDRPKTTVTEEQAKSIISRNDSPDIPFSQSINPYRGCEHGCSYCYARPSHAYWGLSAGLDFETKLFAKTNAATLLRQELSKPSYRCELIALGANTDPYQPVERDLKITRGILEVLAEFNHPVGIVTKSAMIERDIDILAPMAEKKLVQVFISITSLDHELSRRLEPRATAPLRRIKAVQTLNKVGIPCGVLVAPIIPSLNDKDMEKVLEAAHEAGAKNAGYTLVRLPYEVKDIFQSWLQQHYPLRAEHVMNQIRHMRGGRENDPRFGHRMHGEGIFAELIEKRFSVACKRLGLNQQRRQSLDTTLFKLRAPVQLSLF